MIREKIVRFFLIWGTVLVGSLLSLSAAHADERLDIMRESLCSLAETRDPLASWKALDASLWLGVNRAPTVRTSSRRQCTYVTQSKSLSVSLSLGVCNPDDRESLTLIYSSDPEEPETLAPFDDKSEIERWLAGIGATRIKTGPNAIEGTLVETEDYFVIVDVDLELGEVGVDIAANRGETLDSEMIRQAMKGICDSR